MFLPIVKVFVLLLFNQSSNFVLDSFNSNRIRLNLLDFSCRFESLLGIQIIDLKTKLVYLLFGVNKVY